MDDIFFVIRNYKIIAKYVDGSIFSSQKWLQDFYVIDFKIKINVFK